MELAKLYDTIVTLLGDAVANALHSQQRDEPTQDDTDLETIRLITQARIVLDIVEGQTVAAMRSRLPQVSYAAIGNAQGISKQASRIRHGKLERILHVHQLDGRRHSMAKAIVSARHRRAAAPARRARRSTSRA